ncbi:MAG: ABC transporter substrate-binding protein [Solirubrobacteraceae bacterium]|nr:ABC transporter substrate-binding protein [Solirubrobacteraceae bacterium]
MAFTACGDDDDDATNADVPAALADSADGMQIVDGLIRIDVGVIPMAPACTIFLGVEKGFFKEEGLAPIIQSQFSGGTVGIPAVMAGQQHFTFGSWGPVTQAAAEGLPVIGVMPNDSAGPRPDDNYSVLVASGRSGVKSMKELAGKTVALNTLKQLSEIQTRATMEAQDVDPSSVKFVALPYPEMGAAMRQGRIDAALLAEPFLSQAEADRTLGIVRLSATQHYLSPNLNETMWTTSRKLYEENPNLVARFQRAIAKSADYCQSNEQEVRDFIPRFTDVDPEIAGKLQLSTWEIREFDPKQVQHIADMAAKYGIIDEKVDMTDYIGQVPPPGAS